jgi:hypothetical protein
MARSKGHGSLLPEGLGDTGRSRRLSDDERAWSRTCANITRKNAVHVSLGRFHWNGCLGRLPDLPEALLRRQPSLSKPREGLSRSSGRRGGSSMRPCGGLAFQLKCSDGTLHLKCSDGTFHLKCSDGTFYRGTFPRTSSNRYAPGKSSFSTFSFPLQDSMSMRMTDVRMTSSGAMGR